MVTIESKLCTAITKSTKKACKSRAQIGSQFCKSHKFGNFKTQTTNETLITNTPEVEISITPAEQPTTTETPTSKPLADSGWYIPFTGIRIW